MPAKKKIEKKKIETFVHDEAARKNIPTAEYEAVMEEDEKRSIFAAYERRDPDLDPQLIWRGKDVKDWSELVVQAPPLYIQEKVHPKVLIDDLRRRSEKTEEKEEIQHALFADLYSAFNGIEDGAKTEFYQHDQNWSNRMILGDSLQVMASLAEREGLRGQVQCIYIDPPYGIKFNSNFQWSTTSRDVKDGNAAHITREPEQVKAFRDTWRDGIHTYLSYLRDRLTVARDLLSESGSIFVQIGDENVHRVRAMMDEVFGDENFVSEILLKKGGTATSNYLPSTSDFILFYARSIESLKYRQLLIRKKVGVGESTGERYDQVEFPDLSRRALSKKEKANPNLIPSEGSPFKHSNPCSQHDNPLHRENPLIVNGNPYTPPPDRQWSSNPDKMQNLIKANRLIPTGKNLAYAMYLDDFPAVPINNFWTDTLMRSAKTYVVETAPSVVERCLLMTTDPGDLVLDPTCGSGTTAYVAEQWGRRWITIDTSRVALALARARVMGARYPYYLLADSPDGLAKEAEITDSEPSSRTTHNKLRLGFVYDRVPHVTLKSIANNAEIDVIYDEFEIRLEPIRKRLNEVLGRELEYWQIPHIPEDPWSVENIKRFQTIKLELAKERGNAKKLQKALNELNHDLGTEYTVDTLPERPADLWTREAQDIHAEWWEIRIKRQQRIDESIVAKAESELLYDKPYDDPQRVRVAGPFTVESLSPHRTLIVGADDELIDPSASSDRAKEGADFTSMVLENLKTAGVQQAHKEDKILFSSFQTGFAGDYISAEARYDESGLEKRAAIFVGPEFGTVSKPDLAAAAREAGDAGFDVLVACAFNYDAMSSEFDKLGKIPVLKARMNADLHMSDELKNTGKGNLFVIFGEPDIDILDAETGEHYVTGSKAEKIQVKVNGVDVFHPSTGKVESNGADGIACWFIDTDYNEESFFVRHAYFLGQNDPYKSLKTSLKAEINEDAWSTLNSDISRPFAKPDSGRIAVKVINHLGDEVMKVFRV